MAQRKLLYITSSRDRNTAAGTSEAYYRRLPFGHAAVLYNLEQLGWHIARMGFYNAWNPIKIRQAMYSLQPDLILTNSVIGFHPIMARRISQWDGPIIHAWDDYYDEIWSACFGRLAGRFMRWFQKRIVKGSDYIITISRFNQERAQAWGKKTSHIPNGCDYPVYDPSLCHIKLAGRFKLVYSGDQSRYKRTYEIVEAMARLPTDFKLYLTGVPNEDLRKQVSENVVYLGYLSKNDMWSVIDQADVLVCTADQDCNAKFHEYLRMKKPILAYDGKPNLLFKHRRNAYLTCDYATAIIELYNSPELRKQIVENAARDIPVFTWGEIARQYDEAFSAIVALYRHNERIQ